MLLSMNPIFNLKQLKSMKKILLLIRKQSSSFDHESGFLKHGQYSTVQYSTVQYSTVQYSTVQCITVQYSAVQYSAVYGTVHYSTALTF